MVSGTNDTQTIITGSLTSSADGRINGWNPQPNSRGTMDIAWTCVTTTFLCTYSILCLNCPASNESWWRTQARKLMWMGIAISGPEFALTAAAGQLAAARDSVKSFRALGHSKWTYRHAFFANMGGFELIPQDGAPFRINSKHIHWLVSRKYIDFPGVSDEELWDKSKQDTLAKLITCFQVGYLILQCIGRVVQGIALTTLELSTMAIVVCAIMTSVCWIAKPLDVRYPIRIRMDVTVAQVLQEAGPIAARPYRQTPLDFVDDLTPSWALNVQPFMKMPVGPFKRPIPRIGDSRLPWLTWTENSCLCFGTMVYASIHMTGWNFHFPTRVEQILWRVSSLILLGATVAFWILESLAMGWRYGGGQELFTRLFTQRSKSSPQEYSHETPFEPRELPLAWEFWSIFPIAFIYAAARVYILVEALLGLRSLPLSAYLTVDWASLFPHI
ncbi:hypothetical protein K469DRAFT_549960 [Zopfia rhizophila CBS 207.26]|uniref:Uncharacterized protein n=1 Tax=Zopfia rhizophila CBS 207.26 TaxID=1314779 RepID=A0A6A6EPW7_9PEZI|nr:hypothetical protein K469DRAFT_549960 [Zopfia rhizophila CBS 207.26]